MAPADGRCSQRVAVLAERLLSVAFLLFSSWQAPVREAGSDRDAGPVLRGLWRWE